jgi:hypothetical protein
MSALRGEQEISIGQLDFRFFDRTGSTAWTCVENAYSRVENIGAGSKMKRREFIALISMSAIWPAVAHSHVNEQTRS